MIRFLIPAVLATAIVSGIVRLTASGGPPAHFRFINRDSITTLDPAAMTWMQDIRMGLTIWEGLCTYDARTTEPIPGCAFPPEISPDKRTYTFRIRPEARWHNGEPVTANDFVYAWRRALEPGTAADYACLLELIDGVKPYVAWRLSETQRIAGIADATAKRVARDAHLSEADRRFAETVAIKALDDRTVRVRLIRPVAYFLDLCAFSTFLPVHTKSIERFKTISDDGLIFYNEQWVKPGNTYYNGPFYMADWKFKRHVRLARNPYYWNREAVKLNTIEMIDVEDRNTAWMLYSGGEVDWLSSIETDYAPKLIASSCSPLEGATNKNGTLRNDIHAFPAFGTYFYVFNCLHRLPDGRPNPFADKRVRQAFAMAVDKQAIVDQVVREGNRVAGTLVPVGSIPGYPEVTGLPHDPARARTLLAEAGHPDGRGLPEIVVLFNTGFKHGDIAQAIVRMWEREIGVRGRVEGKEVKTFQQDRKSTNFIIARGSWYGDYGDPTTFLDLCATGNGNNDSKFSDGTYDRMLADAEKETDPARRLAVLADAERYLVNECVPVLPLYQYVNTFAFRPERVKNLFLTPRMMTMLRAVEVVR